MTLLITTYEYWRGAMRGDDFDQATDRFMNRAAFPTQPADFAGVSVAKKFYAHGEVPGGLPRRNVRLVTSQLNEPRRMQLGLKLYW